MRKRYIFILLAIFVQSCTNTPKRQDVSLVCMEVTINERFKELLKQFIKENPCTNCMNKVFIDKVYDVGQVDYKNIITIQQMPFNKDDYKKLRPTPILKLEIDSTTFFLYSGIEGFLKVKVDSIKSVKRYDGGNFVNWTIIDQKDTFLINKRGIPPFSPFSVPTNAKIEE